MRIASFNVENLFARAKVLGLPESESRPVLAAQAELNQLLEKPVYAPEDKVRILALLEQLGLDRSDDSALAILRKIRGQLLRRPRTGPVEVVADGRSSWIGWVEFKTEAVDALAMQHTAMVLRDLDPDICGVVEADNRFVLKHFTDSLLTEVAGQPYDQVMLVDGNDDRGIDVGVLARGKYPLVSITTHVFDSDAEGVIFSRDCCEYHFRGAGRSKLVLLVNHLKSKGYSTPGDPIGVRRRTRQATRVAAIYQGLRRQGVQHIAVVGDFNDDPASAALAPLISGTDLRDISEHANFDFGPRKGTFGSGNEKDKIDYILLSPELFARATGGGIFRKGVWHGPRTKDPWPIYDTMTTAAEAASDHAAIFADLDL